MRHLLTLAMLACLSGCFGSITGYAPPTYLGAMKDFGITIVMYWCQHEALPGDTRGDAYSIYELLSIEFSKTPAPWCKPLWKVNDAEKRVEGSLVHYANANLPILTDAPARVVAISEPLPTLFLLTRVCYVIDTNLRLYTVKPFRNSTVDLKAYPGKPIQEALAIGRVEEVNDRLNMRQLADWPICVASANRQARERERKQEQGTSEVKGLTGSGAPEEHSVADAKSGELTPHASGSQYRKSVPVSQGTRGRGLLIFSVCCAVLSLIAGMAIALHRRRKR